MTTETMTETLTENASGQKPASSAVSIGDESVPIGVRLRTQREFLGLTAEDIAASLKIPARKVKAIEAEQWEALPTGPYMKGFLRSYAKALRIDAQQLIEQIDSSLMQSRSPDTILRMPQSFETPLPRPPIDASDWKRGRRMIYLGLALLVLIGLIVWSGTQSFNDLRARIEAGTTEGTAQGTASVPQTAAQNPPAEAASTLPPASAGDAGAATETVTTHLETPGLGNVSGNAVAVAPVSSPVSVSASGQAAATVSSTATENTSGSPAPSSVPLVLSFSADTWVEIRQADGKILMSRINPANTSTSLAVLPPAEVTIGNASGIKLQYRNEAFDLSPYVRDNVARLTLK